MFRMRNNLIGEQIKVARRHHNPPLSQERLAEMLQLQGWDISRTGIAKIEIGLRQVTDVEVVHLARALAVSLAWLFGECGKNEEQPCE